MSDIVIVEAVRSPVGRRGGELSTIHPSDLLSEIQSALIERSGVDPATIGQVVGGCVSQAGEQTANIARQPSMLSADRANRLFLSHMDLLRQASWIALSVVELNR